MAYKVVDCDNIRETFIGANSQTITLGGAAPDSRPFSSKYSNGDTFKGAARAGAEIAVGKFTYNGATVAQTAIRYSSNSNNPVTFSGGADGEIFVDLPSSDCDTLNLEEITVTSAATFDIGAVDGLFINSSGTTGPVTSLGTAVNKLRFVKWSGQTVNHNATTLKLIGAANWVTVSGDYSLMKSDASGNWQEVWRRYADAGQVKFPATQNASTDPNTLDDYEEGTWTPAITFGGGSTGLTYTTRVATYRKIGSWAWVQGYILTSNKGSSTGGAAISGFPFTASGTANNYAGVPLHANLMATTGPYFGYVTPSTSVLTISYQNGGNLSAASDAQFNNVSEIILGFGYITAS